jgi:spore germination protein YaaH
MLNKKIMSLTLAALTTASLAAPAFAASNTSTATNTQTVITTTYAEIPISVTVPATGTAQINPYGLPVEFTKSASSTKSAKVSGQQIVSQPLYIVNEGDVALSIGATVTTTAQGVTIAKEIKEGDEDKDAVVRLEMKQSANKTLDDAGKDKIIDEFAATDTWASVDEDSQVLLSTDDPVEKDGLATLAASKVTTTTDTSNKTTKTVTYNAGSIVLFRLAGEVVTKPSTAWATTDTFTTTIAFTFTPSTEG